MNLRLFIFSISCILLSCSPKIQVRTAQQADVEIMPRSIEVNPRSPRCQDPLAYVEHDYLRRVKYIRINIHFMNSTDGRYNIPEEEVADYARSWIDAANSIFPNNMKMFLPVGNNTPQLPIPYKYVITPDPAIPGDDGIYYHVDDELCYVVKTGRERNISDKRVIKKYAVNPDSVLNIFVQTHHLDSIKSKTYKPDASGISLGSSVKIFGRWFEKPDVWGLRAITNHEIGHSLGLSHTWLGHDGCDDTPEHPNCWNVSEKPPCDSLFSNNMMDYNAHMAAVTPCQIGKVLMNMARIGSIQRNILQPRWCTLDTTANITITDSVRWSCSADLEGNLVIAENATLEIDCRVSLPKDAKIDVHPGARLIVLSNGKLHNSCDDIWLGIKLIKKGKESGRLILMEGAVVENTIQPLDTTP